MKQKQKNLETNNKEYYRLREDVLELKKDLNNANEVFDKYLNREKIFLSDIQKVNKVFGYDVPIRMTSVIQNKDYF
tara:strand:- start:2124 stop:2351 length:228 start_codon:yes stop_codon:yes gene_type:complete